MTRAWMLALMVLPCLLVGAPVADAQEEDAPPPAEEGERKRPRDRHLRQPKLWSASVWGGYSFGDQVIGSTDFPFVSGAVARAVSSSLALSATVTWLPIPDQRVLPPCPNPTEGCPRTATIENTTWEMALGMRFANYRGGGLTGFAEFAPAIYYGRWTRVLTYEDASRNVEEPFNRYYFGFHLALVFPIRISRSMGVEVGVRYLWSENVDIADITGVDQTELNGLRQTQVFGGFGWRF